MRKSLEDDRNPGARNGLLAARTRTRRRTRRKRRRRRRRKRRRKRMRRRRKYVNMDAHS